MSDERVVVPTLQTVTELANFLSEKREFDMFRDAPPVDVDKIAQLLGIVVDETADFDVTDTVGKITLTAGEPARVWINPLQNTYTPRRRFTLAHEIGHFCMHRSKQDEFIDDKSTMSRSESYWNRYESEANSFAADLLMPTNLIKAIGRKVIDTYKAEHQADKMPASTFVETMAVKFRVSGQAMEYRLKNIGILTAKPR